MGADMFGGVVDVVDVVDVVGSALCPAPVKDWKPSKSSAVGAVEVIMDVLLLQWARALVACCAGSGASSLVGAWTAARPGCKWAVRLRR
jgi:hypothetical protein